MNMTDIQNLKQRFGIIGNADKLNRAIFMAAQVASTDISVLIVGESGVGKEVFSKIIHQLSTRKHNQFIAINCGAIPEGTIDSELFGHEKGSFTGASDKRNGYFETVDGGTIFLDEIGEMPLGTQARLLRMLETGEFIKVGSSKVQKTNVRVIAASHISFDEAIARGRFREDLYYRLNTVTINIPPLRERREDIPLLFRKFAVDFADKYQMQPIRLDAAAEERLKNAEWKGNIRQLKNIAEQISVLEQHRTVEGDQIIKYLPNPSTNAMLALPNLIENYAKNEPNLSEREILYKVLFDMRKDLNDLKKVVGQIVEQNQKPLPTNIHTKNEKTYIEPIYNNTETQPSNDFLKNESINNIYNNFAMPMGRAEKNNNFAAQNNVQDIEENLTLADVEKRMIVQALLRHQGRRKNAAIELGISERTLYRKIKEYGLE